MDFFWDIFIIFSLFWESFVQALGPLFLNVSLLCFLLLYFWVLYIVWILILFQTHSWQRFIPILWASSSFGVNLFYLCSFSFMKSLLSIVGLNFGENGVLMRKSFPTPLPCRVLTMFSFNGFRFYDLMVPDILGVSFLCKVIYMGLILLFCMWTFSFPYTVWWRHFILFCLCFGIFCQILSGQSYVYSCLGLQFCSIDLQVYFSASTTLIFLPWLCSIA